MSQNYKGLVGSLASKMSLISLGGKYITAEDVGMSAQDMKYVKMETDFV